MKKHTTCSVIRKFHTTMIDNSVSNLPCDTELDHDEMIQLMLKVECIMGRYMKECQSPIWREALGRLIGGAYSVKSLLKGCIEHE